MKELQSEPKKPALRPKRVAVFSAAVVAVLALAVVAATPVSAHAGTNHGTIKVHDDADADPDPRNEPHVDCDFFVEGFNMAGSNGTLIFYSWPPTGDMTEIMNDTWTGVPEEEGEGFHFLNGPYELESGHYRVEAYLDEGRPGNTDHFSKAKMFWVECSEEEVPSECPEFNLQALPREDGSILVSWNELGEGEEANLYRAEGEGEFVYVNTFGQGTNGYLDTNTTVGVTYTYAITSFDSETQTETEICEMVEATAIPVFPTLIAGALASIVGVAAYAGLRRRQ